MPTETQVGNTIANIGALVGGIFAPHHVAESNKQDSEVTGSDSVMDDDNIISLTVSSISLSLLDLSKVTKLYKGIDNMLFILYRYLKSLKEPVLIFSIFNYPELPSK